MTLATLTYRGRAPRKMGLPSRLSEIAPLSSPQRVRQFHVGTGMMMGMNFMLNGKQFDPERIDTPVKLGIIEEWEYVNDTPMDHPMHLHVNSFQAISPDGEPERAWRDVINVKANSTARFRVAFRDFAGKTVQHCHILDHEDRGLMATVLIEQ